MSVRRLFSEMDSYELSQWRAFLEADADFKREQQERAEEDARILNGLG
jgi:hypothetical protein